jgi:hypothetical protein
MLRAAPGIIKRGVMKISVKLEQGKMSERQVREHIDKAAAMARNIEAQKGRGDISQESMRKLMESNADRDRKDGKI